MFKGYKLQKEVKYRRNIENYIVTCNLVYKTIAPKRNMSERKSSYQ